MINILFAYLLIIVNLTAAITFDTLLHKDIGRSDVRYRLNLKDYYLYQGPSDSIFTFDKQMNLLYSDSFDFPDYGPSYKNDTVIFLDVEYRDGSWFYPLERYVFNNQGVTFIDSLMVWGGGELYWNIFCESPDFLVINAGYTNDRFELYDKNTGTLNPVEIPCFDFMIFHQNRFYGYCDSNFINELVVNAADDAYLTNKFRVETRPNYFYFSSDSIITVVDHSRRVIDYCLSGDTLIKLYPIKSVQYFTVMHAHKKYIVTGRRPTSLNDGHYDIFDKNTNEHMEITIPPKTSVFWTSDTMIINGESEYTTFIKFGEGLGIERSRMEMHTNTLISCNPNPFGSMVNISYNINTFNGGVLEIYNIAGQVVFQRQIQDEGVVSWSANSNPPGIYILKFMIGGKQYSRKIVLQR